eukprot:TRINITY_DN4870_c0_g1_i1.p2 TRINITY_DN4870_c0_g1~~TRINITY_DN4870_c0_g1_i1.p2  ORF type:complete len:123 (+),score=8.93 TRINITY_DN4870_c0_g1_i1:33-371(+)
MAAVAALLPLCFGALSPCPVPDVGAACIGGLASIPGSQFDEDRRIAVSPDDTLVAVGSHPLHVYNVSTGAALAVPSYDHAHEPAFSPAGNKLAVAAGRDGAAVFSLSSGAEL